MSTEKGGSGEGKRAGGDTGPYGIIAGRHDRVGADVPIRPLLSYFRTINRFMLCSNTSAVSWNMGKIWPNW